MDPSKIREKIGRFRILVIGRANAGKTTILQRVCNTRDNPEIYNSAGEKIDATILMASTERGEHDIEHEMVFQSNPGFVFHDSCGFEAGGESEFGNVKAFIARRSKEVRLTNQLHAIWYCIPMDEASRSFTKGEIKFFSCNTGSIPVIVLFTKFDALYNTAYAELKSEGASRKQAEELAPQRAEESFAIGSQLQFLYHSKDIRRPPKCHVCLASMDKDDADCGSLIECTAATLDDEMLKQLFVSTQQTNLELCMKYAVERILPEFLDSETPASKGHEEIIGRLAAWFPHIVAVYHEGYVEYEEGEGHEGEEVYWDRVYAVHVGEGHGVYVHGGGRYTEYYGGGYERGQVGLDDMRFMNKEKLYRADRAAMGSKLLSVGSHSSPLGNIVQLSSAAIIILEHSFYIFDTRRYLRDQQESVPSCLVALEQYMASPHAGAVREGVSAAVQAYKEAVATAARAYEEAVATAARAYEEAETTAARAYEEAVTTAAHAFEEAVRTLPAWIAKLPFERLQRKAKEAFERSKEKEKEAFERSKKMERVTFERSKKMETEAFKRSKEEEKKYLGSQAKAELIKTLLEITLNHRLPRP